MFVRDLILLSIGLVSVFFISNSSATETVTKSVDTYSCLTIELAACQANNVHKEWFDNASAIVKTLSDHEATVQRVPFRRNSAERFILTSHNGRSFDFIEQNFSEENHVLLGLENLRQSHELVNRVRGKGRSKQFLLGQFTDHQALVVSAPKRPGTQYDLQGYGDFQKQYQNRREMIYIASNDGIVHAFNGGWPSRDHLPPKQGEATWPVGKEAWAYIPEGVLASLKDLFAEENRESSLNDLSVEGSRPYAFDAKVFADSATHPHGWGTILVLGSGTSQKNGDAYNSCLLFDITDPEEAPVLMSEFKHPEMGSCTAKPSPFTLADKSGAPAWYLAFGSGEGAHRAEVYFYDLNQKSLTKTILLDERSNYAYIGGITAVDLDFDGLSDLLYFGTVVDRGDEQRGSLYSLTFNKSLSSKSLTRAESSSRERRQFKRPRLTKLLEPSSPIPNRPLVKKGPEDNVWVYFSTGKLNTRDGNTSSIKVFSKSSIYAVKDDFTRTQMDEYQLGLNFSRAKGWYRHLPSSEIFYSGISDFGAVIAIQSYDLVSKDCCSQDGSRLNFFHAYTGELLDELLSPESKSRIRAGRMLNDIGSFPQSRMGLLSSDPSFLSRLSKYNNTQIDPLEREAGKDIDDGVRRLSWWQQ